MPSEGKEMAEALASCLSRIEARSLDDPEAEIAAFPDPRVAHQISNLIDSYLKVPGATDITAAVRGSDRVVEVDGCTFLLPTVIWCEDWRHPLANTEFLFPFVSIVDVPQKTMLERIGPTLVVTAITEDSGFKRDLLTSTAVDRLNLGPIPTNQISWDQPHEGNLFDFLYQQRALQIAPTS